MMENKIIFEDKRKLLYKFLIKFVAPLTINIFVKKINNLQNFQKKKAFIIASNHASLLDPMIIGFIFAVKFRVKVYFIGKEDVFSNFFSRMIQEAGGTIKLNSSDKGALALKTADCYLKKDRVIGIFPEGERSYYGKLLKAKTGVARLAISAKVPVLPLVIQGTHELMPRGALFPKFKKEVTINIGKFLYFDKYYNKKISKKDYRIITNEIMLNIKTLIEKKK